MAEYWSCLMVGGKLNMIMIRKCTAMARSNWTSSNFNHSRAWKFNNRMGFSCWSLSWSMSWKFNNRMSFSCWSLSWSMSHSSMSK